MLFYGSSFMTMKTNSSPRKSGFQNTLKSGIIVFFAMLSMMVGLLLAFAPEKK